MVQMPPPKLTSFVETRFLSSQTLEAMQSLVGLPGCFKDNGSPCKDTGYHGMCLSKVGRPKTCTYVYTHFQTLMLSQLTLVGPVTLKGKLSYGFVESLQGAQSLRKIL